MFECQKVKHDLEISNDLYGKVRRENERLKTALAETRALLAVDNDDTLPHTAEERARREKALGLSTEDELKIVAKHKAMDQADERAGKKAATKKQTSALVLDDDEEDPFLIEVLGDGKAEAKVKLEQ